MTRTGQAATPALPCGGEEIRARWKGRSARARRAGGRSGELAQGGGQAREGLGATGHGLLQRTADLLNLPRVQVGREHFPGAVHQVVGFVHEERVIARLLGEVAAQIDLGVEHVVVVAHDDIHPGGQVERKLEGADLVLAADGLQHGPGDFLARQRGAHGGSAAVVVAARKGAGRAGRRAGLPGRRSSLWR